MPIASVSTHTARTGAFCFSLPTLGLQMQAAYDIVCASSSEEVDKQLRIARQFAASHSFYLPTPKTGQVSTNQYRMLVVPWFTYHMRDKFDAGLHGIQESKSSFESFRNQGLLDISLPDIAKAGLLTYRVLEDTLLCVEEDVEQLMASAPQQSSRKAAYLLQTIKSPWLHSAVIGAILMLLGISAPFAVAAFVGLALVEKWILKRFSNSHVIDERGENRYTKEELSKALTYIQRRGEELVKLHAQIPPSIALPPSVTPELKKAEFLDKAGKEGRDVSQLIDKLEVIEGPSDLCAIVNQDVNYVVVQSEDGKRREIRVASDDADHLLLVLKGERIVCSGSFLCLKPKGAYRLMIDGDSTSQNNEAITKALREKLGDGVEIFIGSGDFSSGEWERS